MDAITAARDDPDRLEFLAETTSALAYRLGSPRSVLVLGAGGGLEILRARQLGAARIDALEVNDQVARLLSTDYSDYTGQLVDQPGVATARRRGARFSGGERQSLRPHSDVTHQRRGRSG
jgi:hypothetical protein